MVVSGKATIKMVYDQLNFVENITKPVLLTIAEMQELLRLKCCRNHGVSRYGFLVDQYGSIYHKKPAFLEGAFGPPLSTGVPATRGDSLNRLTG